MADREMTDLYKAVTIGRDVEIDVAETAQRILRCKSAEGYYGAVGGASRSHRIEDIRRAPRATDRDYEVTRTSVKLNLLREDPLISEIIAKTGKHRAIIERKRTDVAILRIIGRHMTSDGGAASVADEYELVAACMGPTGKFHHLINRIAHLEDLA